ncbi:hypothetical protein VB151_12660 [Xanthomonas fragariae]|uniref:Uncharacterized protein n=1 Tax=Xanthomonas fragariae TaxID=48664 RepID=A0A1Y6HRC7_9XANT|nr:hypothetical protein [Xanthomonas fragariae]AOD16804.1 hypothetical protein BER92_19570 [Xanthomonas fragariae]AOD20202.1 hypothetical protein BER93_19625 [Xanthomonas fragariae]ENZ96484.1 hypothetical protein O1K_04411 [Xanthomonas fragariae LMG 25863]MDM7555405.1 hypothetical protein [Xanthomonas fragariae]MDM7558514.1 hypothetical protein [Xanthomonas fragariae]
MGGAAPDPGRAGRDGAGPSPGGRGGGAGSLYGADLGFYLQNAGLGSTASLDDFSAKILAALDGPRAAQAGTARRADLDARGKQRQEELSGSTRRGYVDGFGLRFAEIRTAWLVLLVLVLVAGGVMSTANRGSVRAGVVAAGISYLVPGLLLIPVFVFLPFLPAWLLFVATLAGTVAMYFAGGRVFALLGLRRVGAYLDSLRREHVRPCPAGQPGRGRLPCCTRPGHARLGPLRDAGGNRAARPSGPPQPA